MNTHSSKTVAIAMAAILASTNIFVPLSVYAETTKSPLTDINDQAIYKDGINYLIGQKIVSGYPDGTYRPSITLNRAEMLKILVGATTKAYLDSYKGKSCFDDVAANEWYTTYVCYGKEKGWVAGYENGKKFRPAQTVNTVEALKMTLGAFGITYTATSDVWYKGIVDTASAQNFIPFDVTSFDAGLRRDQMADLIARVLLKKDNKLEDYLQEKAKIIATYDTIKAGKNLAAESMKNSAGADAKAKIDAEAKIKADAEASAKAEAAKLAAEKEAAAKAAEEAQTPGEPFLTINPWDETSVYVEVYDPHKDGGQAIDYYIVEQLVDGVYKPFAISYKKDQANSKMYLTGLVKGKTYTFKFTAVNKLNKKSKGESVFTILFGNMNTYPTVTSDGTQPDRPTIYMTNQDNGTVTFTIQAPKETAESPITGYLVRRKVDGKYSPYQILLPSENGGQYIFSNLDQSAGYTYDFQTLTLNRKVSNSVTVDFIAKKGGAVQIN